MSACTVCDRRLLWYETDEALCLFCADEHGISRLIDRKADLSNALPPPCSCLTPEILADNGSDLELGLDDELHATTCERSLSQLLAARCAAFIGEACTPEIKAKIAAELAQAMRDGVPWHTVADRAAAEHRAPTNEDE